MNSQCAPSRGADGASVWRLILYEFLFRGVGLMYGVVTNQPSARMRAARVTVVVLCMCVCVSTHTCHLTHWNHKKKDTNGFIEIQGSF